MGKSRIYEKFYGCPYVPKTLIKIKKCLGCGREFMPGKKTTKECCFCGGDLVCKYVVRKSVDQRVQKNQQKRLKT